MNTLWLGGSDGVSKSIHKDNAGNDTSFINNNRLRRLRLASKHAHESQITEIKNGDDIRLCMR